MLLIKINVLNDGIFVKKTGDIMTGDLILPHYNFPVQGNTNKAISYETQREIFLSRKESFPMQTDINMDNNVILNLPEPTLSNHLTTKEYVDHDQSFSLKLDKNVSSDINMNNKKITNVAFDTHPTSAVRVQEMETKLAKHGGTLSGPV